LFRGFRLAIDPSKLALALALILLLFLGGRLMDGIWPNKHRAIVDEMGTTELVAYQLTTTSNRVDTDFGRDPDRLGNEGAPGRRGRIFPRVSASEFQEGRKTAVATNRVKLKDWLKSLGKTEEGDVGDLKKALKEQLDDNVNRTSKAYDDLPYADKTEAAAKTRDENIRSLYARYRSDHVRAETLDGQGLFITFLSYEIDQVDGLMQSIITLDFRGALGSIQNFFVTAPSWAIRVHPVFFAIFFLYFLLLWSIFGGAVSRIAAVQEARDEKISVRQALRFSTGKVLSFFFAPLIPIIIIGFIALVLGLVFAVTQAPWGLGSVWLIVVAVLFFLALLGGLVMALTGIGLVGGGHLMYPTIAVEGSDSFDAVSRSFSYLYARPWQLLWYTFVSLLYGAITYLFVRFFLHLLLWLTHAGVSMFMYKNAADGSSLMNAIWAGPTDVMKLAYDPDWAVLRTLQCIGAGIMAFWIYLAISMIGAYAISLYFSSSTIIYYLMRREVDATAIDEVYLEPNDDEFVDTAGPETATVTTMTTTTVTETVLPPSSDVSNPGNEPPPATGDQSPTA
jgi:hypothetical protein